MKQITVNDIIKVCNGKLVYGNEKQICESFSRDTRQIAQGDVYIGIKGENFDGNILYEEALKKGASVCILQNIEISKKTQEKYKNSTIILVENTIDALGKIAKLKRSLYNIPVVAVTGSVGKTSTKDIIASVVSKKYNVCKTQGNFNNHIGLPLTILGLKNHEALVVEMGMNHFGEISKLTDIAKPTIAVITNIGTSHIGNLGSRENILKAKLEILEGLDKDGTIIINNDNDLLNNWNKKNTKYKTITYGIEEKSDFKPYNIKINENGSSYNIDINNKKYEIEVPVSGKHFVYNSMSAIAVGKVLNIDMKDVITGIKEFELTKKRMDIQKMHNGITLINDSYNASYDSMKSALEYLKDISGKRKIAVLGNMLELGHFTKELHEKVGKEVYNNKIDILVTIGDLAKDISKEAIKLGMKTNNIYIYDNNKQALNLLENILKEGDIVLFKASNAMHFTDIVEELKN